MEQSASVGGGGDIDVLRWEGGGKALVGRGERTWWEAIPTDGRGRGNYPELLKGGVRDRVCAGIYHPYVGEGRVGSREKRGGEGPGGRGGEP